ncbi:MAG: caspase family protein [Granulosicoccus sp.]
MTLMIAVFTGCAATPPGDAPAGANRDPSSLLVVDCLLPGQVRRLGTQLTYMSPRRPIKTAASFCEIRGGEYVAYDRSNFATALKIWLPKAQEGDKQAQTYVGEIYEKGLGVDADYALAGEWYRRAAVQGYSRAQINLGYLFEAGLGVEPNLTTAMNYYRDASGLADGDIEYVSSVEYANRESTRVQSAALQQQVTSLQQTLAEAQALYQEQQQTLSREQSSLDALRQQVEEQRRIVVTQATSKPDNAPSTTESLQRIQSLESELTSARTEQRRLTDKLVAQQRDTALVRQQFANSNRELGERRDELEDNQATIERLEAQLGNQASDTVGLQQQLDAVLASTAELEAAVVRLNKSRSAQDVALENELHKAESREGELASSLDEQTANIANLLARLKTREKLYKDEIAELQNSLQGTHAEQERLISKIAAAEVQSAESTAQNAQLQASLDQQTQLVATREAEQQRLMDKIALLQLSSTSEETERVALEAQLGSANATLAQARAEQNRLTERMLHAELSARVKGQRDASTIASLDEALADSQRQLQIQEKRVALLQSDLVNATALLDSAPDRAERVRLQQTIAEQADVLAAARNEQQRLTDLLLNQQIKTRTQQKDADIRLVQLEQALLEREAVVDKQQQRLTQLQSDVSRTRVQLTTRDVENIDSVLARGPSIDIIEPPVMITRGSPVLPVPTNGALEVIGKIDPSDSLLAFKINGQTQALNTAGVFQYTVKAAERSIELVAVDAAGASTRLALQIENQLVEASSTAPQTRSNTNVSVSDIPFGKYYALIIGNDDYQSLTNLNTAGNDAREVERTLRENYGFQTELLLNATRYDMLSALNRLRETLGSEDNLVIYYAGHGEIDRTTRRGYWLPVDADAADTENWISNSAITDYIDAMKAKHVLVIADSCYSGTLTRSSVARLPPDTTAELKAKWLRAISASKVRAVLSSGGVKPIYDGGPNAEHSLFARVFLDELNQNSGVLEAYSLFVNVQRKVAQSARQLNVDQNPQYAPIRHSGHEAGEFIFVPGSLQRASMDSANTSRLAQVTPVDDPAVL